MTTATASMRTGPIDFAAEAERFRRRISRTQVHYLAKELGVRPDALDAVEIGWADEKDLRLLGASGEGWGKNYPPGAFAFPERDADDAIVGFSFRAPDGRKGSPSSDKGARRGLIIPRTLSRLAGPILLVEGCSDVCAAITLGRTAIGRPSNRAGAELLAKCCREQDVLVVGENDRKADGRWPGRDGAEAVAERLTRSWRRGVRWSMPPGDSKDTRAWLNSRAGAGLDINDAEDAGRAGDELVAAMISTAEVEEPPQAARAWRPFPVNLLPEPLAGYVKAVSAALGCDPAMVALPALAAVAGAIGYSAAVELKPTWREPAVVWAAIVARSGTLKSPAMDKALWPLRRLQSGAFKEHEELLNIYHTDLAEWEKKPKADRDGDDRPSPPRCERFLVSDVTVEALAPLIKENPRGVLLERDELAGWVRGFDRYRPTGRGGDAALWLEMWRAGPITVDRKGGEPRTIHVPAAPASVVGTIQPGILRAAFGREHLENGVAARTLFAMPPHRPKRWSSAGIDRDTSSAYNDLIVKLARLQPEIDAQGVPQPATLPMDTEAARLWSDFYNDHAKMQADAGDECVAAALAKIEAYAARFALIFQMIKWAAGSAQMTCVDAASMKAAIGLARWFSHEAARLYQLFGESEVDGKLRSLLEWVRGRGSSTTVREVTRNVRGYGDAQAAREALDALVRQGLMTLERPKPASAGGRPKEVYAVVEAESADTADADETSPEAAPGTPPADETPSGGSAAGGFGSVGNVGAPGQTPGPGGSVGAPEERTP